MRYSRTDGCGGQYKNCKNFLLLCSHEERFGLKASWSFFATSHGKSSCDAVGGAVKRAVRAESLRRVKANDTPINNVDEFYKYCQEREDKERTSVTHFLLKREVIDTMRKQVERLKPQTVEGTRSFHNFVPIAPTVIGCKRLSNDEHFSLQFDLMVENIGVDSVIEGSYVACVLDNKWIPGYVASVRPNEREAQVLLLTETKVGKKKVYLWPDFNEPLDLPFAHVLQEINVEIKSNYIQK